MKTYVEFDVGVRSACSIEGDTDEGLAECVVKEVGSPGTVVVAKGYGLDVFTALDTASEHLQRLVDDVP